MLASMRNLRLAETRAATDLLTGLPNRRSAEETLKLLLANADRSVTPLAVAMFDLDHFKKVNDVFGHEKGDQLLAAVGDVAATSTRVSDFVARFGGEEFLVLLPNTDVSGAVLALDKLREGIARLHVLGAGHSPSASFGVAVFPDDGVDAETLAARRRPGALRRQVGGTELRQGAADARRRGRVGHPDGHAGRSKSSARSDR